jgi:hypothetical protein
MSPLAKRIIVAIIAIPLAFVFIYFGEIVFSIVVAIISSIAL